MGDSYKERVPILGQKMNTKSGLYIDRYYNELQNHGEMWRTVVKYVLTAALGLVIGLVATQIGLG